MEEQTSDNPVKRCKNNSYILADFFIKEYPNIVGSLNSKDSIELYNFTGKIYEHISDYDLDYLISEFFKKHKITDRWKMSVLNEMKRAIFVSSELRKADFDNYSNLLCFKNGIYDLKTEQLKEHDKKYYFTSLINIDYEPTQEDTTNLITFLQQILRKDNTEPDEEAVDLMLKIGGYLLYPKNTAKVMFVFLGDGANGKSLLIDIFSMFFAEKHITCTDLEILTDPKTAEREAILNSRINISTETSGQKGAINAQQLKKIISGEEIDIFRKYKNPIKRFKPNTKIIIAANHDPYLNDTSYGINRRFITISFPCRFVPLQDYQQIKNPQDKNIYPCKDFDSLLNSFKEELPAILNLFLKHLKLLKENNFVFPNTNNTTQTKIEYGEATDSLGDYLKDNFVEDDNKNTFIAVQDILAEYRAWYKINVSEKSLNLSSNHISRRIKSIFSIKSFSHSFYQGNTRLRKKSFYLRQKTYEDEITGDIQNNQGGGETPSPELLGEQTQQSIFPANNTAKEADSNISATETDQIPQESKPGLETQIFNFAD